MAVKRPEVLGDKGEEVEKVLEAIVGYATGLDWDTSLEHSRRLALLQWALISQYWADRKHAVESLGEIGLEEMVIPILIQALGDEHAGVSVTAARVLEGRGAKAIPALIEALGDADEDVREAAAETLGEIGPEAKGGCFRPHSGLGG